MTRTQLIGLTIASFLPYLLVAAFTVAGMFVESWASFPLALVAICCIVFAVINNKVISAIRSLDERMTAIERLLDDKRKQSQEPPTPPAR